MCVVGREGGGRGEGGGREGGGRGEGYLMAQVASTVELRGKGKR